RVAEDVIVQRLSVGALRKLLPTQTAEAQRLEHAFVPLLCVSVVSPRGKSKASRFVKELFDERARASPTRVAEEVNEVVQGERRVAARRALVVRPVDEHRATDDEVARDEAPEAAVLAVVAVVAHDEVVVFGHVEGLAADYVGRRFERFGKPVDVVVEAIRRGRVRARQRVALHVCQWRALLVAARSRVVVVRRVIRRDSVLFERLAVDENLRASDFDVVARQPYHTLHVVRLITDGVAHVLGTELNRGEFAGVVKDEYVAASYLA